MHIRFHRNFERQYKKLRDNERARFKERVGVFLKNQFDPVIHNHPLHGKYRGYRSINIGGDLRAVYRVLEADAFLFVAIGTHDQLYK